MISWRCVKKECKSSLKTNLIKSIINSVPSEHNHAENPNEIAVREVRNEMREKSLKNLLKPRKIISSSIRDTAPEISALIPEYSSLQRNIQHIRKRSAFPYINPQTTQELLIPEEFKITYRNQRFILSDTYIELVGRIIIYCTQRAQSLLEQSTSVFFDGTFKTVPLIFFQLYTIHCESHNNIIPCIFILMEKKTQLCYNKIWQILSEKFTLNFLFSMSDFEIAAINSFRSFFPNCQISCCFFSF